jgi:hypothetical protein
MISFLGNILSAVVSHPRPMNAIMVLLTEQYSEFLFELLEWMFGTTLFAFAIRREQTFFFFTLVRFLFISCHSISYWTLKKTTWKSSIGIKYTLIFSIA